MSTPLFTRLLSLIFIPLIFLSSCSIDWNDDKDTKIAELQKQIQEDTFKKKQECFAYKGKVEEEYKKEQKEKNDSTSRYRVDEIFYSKKLNTCILKTSQSTYNSHIGHDLEEYLLNNTLTGEPLGRTAWDCSFYDADEKLKEYCEKKLTEFRINLSDLKGE